MPSSDTVCPGALGAPWHLLGTVESVKKAPAPPETSTPFSTLHLSQLYVLFTQRALLLKQTGPGTPRLPNLCSSLTASSEGDGKAGVWEARAHTRMWTSRSSPGVPHFSRSPSSTQGSEGSGSKPQQ